jgi:hypothetical protein
MIKAAAGGKFLNFRGFRVFCGRFRVRGRGGSADPRKGVEVVESEVERGPAVHGKAGQRAAFAVGFHGILRVDERNERAAQILVELTAYWSRPPRLAAFVSRDVTRSGVSLDERALRLLSKPKQPN